VSLTLVSLTLQARPAARPHLRGASKDITALHVHGIWHAPCKALRVRNLRASEEAMPPPLRRTVIDRVLVGLMLVVSVAVTTPAWSEPCVLPDVSMPVLREAMARLTRPAALAAAPEPGRWHALLPSRVNLLVRGGERAGTYTNEVGPALERDLYVADRGMTVRLDWDLRPLWAPPLGPRQPPADLYLNHAVHAEELANRVARQLKDLRKAQAVALVALNGDPVCHDARADAEAALLVLESVVSSARR